MYTRDAGSQYDVIAATTAAIPAADAFLAAEKHSLLILITQTLR